MPQILPTFCLKIVLALGVSALALGGVGTVNATSSVSSASVSATAGASATAKARAVSKVETAKVKTSVSKPITQKPKQNNKRLPFLRRKENSPKSQKIAQKLPKPLELNPQTKSPKPEQISLSNAGIQDYLGQKEFRERVAGLEAKINSLHNLLIVGLVLNVLILSSASLLVVRVLFGPKHSESKLKDLPSL